MTGTSAAMQTAIRQLLASVLVAVSELTFNGTITPVAVIIFAYLLVASLCYLKLQLNEKREIFSQETG